MVGEQERPVGVRIVQRRARPQEAQRRGQRTPAGNRRQTLGGVVTAPEEHPVALLRVQRHLVVVVIDQIAHVPQLGRFLLGDAGRRRVHRVVLGLHLAQLRFPLLELGKAPPHRIRWIGVVRLDQVAHMLPFPLEAVAVLERRIGLALEVLDGPTLERHEAARRHLGHRLGRGRR